MKLTNLNCPHCNGFLNQQGESFFCTSCGSAFTIDYDEDDVRYADLVTQADRTRQMIARDVELMNTRYQIREEMARRKDKRDWDRERKKDLRSIASVTITYVIMSLASFGLIVGFLIYLTHSVKSSQKDEASKAQESVSSMVEILKKDKSTIMNAAQAGRDQLLKERKAEILDDEYVKSRTAERKGEPQVCEAYVVYKSDDDCRLTFVFDSVFVYQDTKEEVHAYDYVSFTTLKLNSNKTKITTDYTCYVSNQTYGTFGGYRELNQLYLECIKADYGGSKEKLDVSFLTEKGGKNG